MTVCRLFPKGAGDYSSKALYKPTTWWGRRRSLHCGISKSACCIELERVSYILYFTNGCLYFGNQFSTCMLNFSFHLKRQTCLKSLLFFYEKTIFLEDAYIVCFLRKSNLQKSWFKLGVRIMILSLKVPTYDTCMTVVRGILIHTCTPDLNAFSHYITCFLFSQ